jgi:hypothetical protein
MKTPALFLLTAAAALFLSTDVRSQSAPPAGSPLQQLQAIQAQNKILLEKQALTLQKLTELQLQAQQLKFFGKRS